MHVFDILFGFQVSAILRPSNLNSKIGILEPKSGPQKSDGVLDIGYSAKQPSLVACSIPSYLKFQS